MIVAMPSLARLDTPTAATPLGPGVHTSYSHNLVDAGALYVGYLMALTNVLVWDPYHIGQVAVSLGGIT